MCSIRISTPFLPHPLPSCVDTSWRAFRGNHGSNNEQTNYTPEYLYHTLLDDLTPKTDAETEWMTEG